MKNAETARVTFIFLTWENGCRHVKLGRRSEEVTTVASYKVCRMEAVVIDGIHDNQFLSNDVIEN